MWNVNCGAPKTQDTKIIIRNKNIKTKAVSQSPTQRLNIELDVDDDYYLALAFMAEKHKWIIKML